MQDICGTTTCSVVGSDALPKSGSISEPVECLTREGDFYNYMHYVLSASINSTLELV